MRRSSIAAAFLIAAFCLQAFLALPRLSATSDESIHIAAGYSYWKTRDFRMNPEHPPLGKALAALPLLLLRPKFDTSGGDWANAEEDVFSVRFLYSNDADRLLFWARAPMVLLAAIGALVTFLWARELFGPAAGVFATALYSFSPNLLAHGMLVTTDVPLAVFTVLTLYLFWKGRDIPAGIALGAAMATKFSGALLPIVLIFLCVIQNRHSALRRLAILACSSLIVIEAAYLFSASPLLYLKNAALVNANHIQNYPFYLFGVMKPGGWWYYFLAALAVKATVPTLLLIVLAGFHAATGWSNRSGEIVLLTTIGAFVVLMSIGADQIGVRYLLPIFPLAFIWTSRLVPYFMQRRAGIVVLLVLALWQGWSGIRSFPNYIPYFNELAGGSSNGPAFLDDSNIDWGQGMKQAADYVHNHHLQNVNLYSFSPLDNPQYYGLPPNIPPSEAYQRLLVNRPTPGIYIISAHYVTRMKTVNPAWSTYQPVDRIGESLWVYVF